MRSHLGSHAQWLSMSAFEILEGRTRRAHAITYYPLASPPNVCNAMRARTHRAAEDALELGFEDAARSHVLRVV